MAWARNFGQMKTDLGTWLGVDKDASNPNYTRLPEDVRAQCANEARRDVSARVGFDYSFDFSSDNDTDDLLTYAWFPVFFTACVSACDYLMEDQRRPIFERLALREISKYVGKVKRDEYKNDGCQSAISAGSR